MKTHAVLKHLSEDFIVEEQAEKWNCSVEKEKPLQDLDSLSKTESQNYLWCELQKENVDHFTAFKMLQQQLGLSQKEIGYAGTKDKRALTVQRISLFQPDIQKIKSFNNPNTTLKNFKWMKRKIKLGYLEGNTFTIALRDIDKKEAMKTATAIKKTKAIPNIFGKQRFGVSNNNSNIGLLILQKKFKEAVQEIQREESPLRRKIDAQLRRRKEDYQGALQYTDRKNILFFVHALQSKLFNEIVQEALTQNIDFTKEGQKKTILPGYKTRFSKGRLGEIEQEILKKNNISLELFNLKEIPFLRIKGSWRNALIQVKDLDVNIQDDEHFKGSKKILLTFTLPSGAYATTFLDSFFEFD